MLYTHISLGTRLQELLETCWGTCMFEDLKKARGPLHQDSPLEREGAPTCTSRAFVHDFGFLPGVHWDLR